jgi:septal ring factor EnvC (AmiA/AmiB activator)
MTPPPPQDDEGQGAGGEGWPRVVPSQPNPYWTQMAEQRLNQLSRDLRETKDSARQLEKRIGEAEGKTRELVWTIERATERIKELREALASQEGTIPDKRRTELVEKIVFGVVALILIAVIGLWLKAMGMGK